MRTKLGKLFVILVDTLLGSVERPVRPSEYAQEWDKTKEIKEEQKMGIIDGKEYGFTEYWKKRLEQVIEKGVTLEELQNLSVDLSMENLTGNKELVQVPCVVLMIPLYTRGEGDVVVPFTMEEEEGVLDMMEELGEINGYGIESVIESVTYIG